MDIKKSTDIKELKSFAYDVIRERERLVVIHEQVERRIAEIEQQLSLQQAKPQLKKAATSSK